MQDEFINQVSNLIQASGVSRDFLIKLGQYLQMYSDYYDDEVVKECENEAKRVLYECWLKERKVLGRYEIPYFPKFLIPSWIKEFTDPLEALNGIIDRSNEEGDQCGQRHSSVEATEPLPDEEADDSGEPSSESAAESADEGDSGSDQEDGEAE